MKGKLKLLAAGMVVLVLATASQAALKSLTIESMSFADLLGGSARPVAPAMVTVYDEGALKATITSQAFTDDLGHYAYLYQLTNTSFDTEEVIVRFTAGPVVSATASNVIGILTDVIPGGNFVLGDQGPMSADINLLAGPTVGVSYYYLSEANDYAIYPGESSKVMVIFSNVAPGIINGSVIDGGTYTGDVIGPVPEPAALSLLALGSLATVVRRRRK